VLAVMGRNGKHHAAVPSSKDLPINYTSTVKARLVGDRFTLLINGSFAGVLAGFRGVAYPSNSDVLVWSGDRFQPPACASISNINYSALPPEPGSNTSGTDTEGESDDSSESPSDGETTGNSPDDGSEGDYWSGEPQGDSTTTEAGDGEGSGDGEAGDGEGLGDGEAGEGEEPGDRETGDGDRPGNEAPAPVHATTSAKKASNEQAATTPAKEADGSMPKPKPGEEEVPPPDKAPALTEAPTEMPPSSSESSTTRSPEEPNKRTLFALGNLALGVVCVILLITLVCRQ